MLDGIRGAETPCRLLTVPMAQRSRRFVPFAHSTLAPTAAVAV